MKILARSYREKIAIQQYVKTQDGQGGYVSAWVTVATVGANFKKPKLATVEAAGAIVSEMTHEIKIYDRHAPDVKKGWRVLHGTKIFSVEHDAYDDDYDQTKVLVCKETAK
jgi:SPP1 family predicted phage head-tail adaptor